MPDFFITSDLHLNHQNIIQYCNRPFSSVEEMNTAIIQNWNNAVSKEDTIYVVGDVIMGSFSDIDRLLGQLNGNKILIVGNHDKPRTKKLYSHFAELHKKYDIEFEGKTVLLRHIPMYNELPPEYEFQICGHVHEKWKVRHKVINASVDVWDFKPVLFETMFDEYLRLCKNVQSDDLHKELDYGEKEEGMGSQGCSVLCP
jgi:calcineurin-like phosphoesterase family protein